MISLKIKDIKTFMSHLLIKNTFDNFLLSEALVSISNTFTIDGTINKSFYTDEERACLDDETYSKWSQIKPFCFNIIKGNKVPTNLKVIFLLSKQDMLNIIDISSLNFEPADIKGLFLNIKYCDDGLTIITGTSLSVFTMDKTLEHSFDKYVKLFLSDNAIDFEEM